MLISLFLASLLATLSLARSHRSLHSPRFSPGFPYGSEKVRGVNLGGWLVLERWITPSLFDGLTNPAIIDEWTFGELQSRTVAKAKLLAHWNTFITEADFQAIANAGLNHVRIPIGYWAYQVGPGEPYIRGQRAFLLKAVAWAAKYNLKVLVDLHGAPGSQNGFANSGHQVPFPQWQSNQTNIDRTNSVIKQIAHDFRNQFHVVSAIGALNEPAGYDGQQMLDVTRQFWYDSYGNIRYPFGTSQQSNTLTVVHDAFQSLSFWDNFMHPPQFQGVAMDTHIYQMFSDQTLGLSNAQHIQNACDNAGRLIDFNSHQLWTIVGEWTPAMTDCAGHNNGPGAGARFDGTISPGAPFFGSCDGKTGLGSTFSQDFKTFLRQTWEAQVITFEKASGWIMWTWKTEQAHEWSYSAGLEFGWIPQDPTQREFPTICG